MDELAELVRRAADEEGEPLQGLLCPEVLISEGARTSEDRFTLVQEVVDFTNWATEEAALQPGEFPLEALCSYYVDYYLAQVNNGGHDQWASNSGWNPLVLAATEAGLNAMGAEAHLQIFTEYRRHMSDPEVARAAMEGAGFGEGNETTEALDSRYFAMDSYALVDLNAAWLRTLPMVRELDREALQARRAEIAVANPGREARFESGRRRRQEAEEQSPVYRSVKAACAAAGAEYRGLTAGGYLPLRMIAPGLPDEQAFCWGVVTDRGVLHVAYRAKRGLFGTKRFAEVYEVGRAKPLGAAPLSKAEYDGVVSF